MRIIWGVIMTAGTMLLFMGITNESLWYDESYTGSIVRQPLADIINITGGDNHPPLYYMMLRIFTLIFGNTVLSLRAFSVIGALALASLGIGPVRRAMGERAGILFTFLTMIMPITFAMAQEARMYTWAAFLVTGSALYGYLGCDEGKTRDWILFGLFSVAAAYTHYYALLAVIMIVALIFLMTLLKKKKLVPFLYAVAAIVIAYIPWLVKLLGAMGRVRQSYWIPPVTADVIQKVFVYPFSNKFSIPAYPNLPAFGYMIAAIIISWGIISQIFNKNKKVIMPVIAMGGYLLTIIAGITASWVIRPVLVERYMVVVLGLFMMALAYGIDNLGKKTAPVIIAAALILAVSGVQIHHTMTNRFNGPMKEAVNTLEVQPGDIFLHTDEHTIGTFSYYYPDHMNYYYVGQGTGGFSNFDALKPNGVVVRSLDELPRDKQIWLVQRPAGLDPSSPRNWMSSGKLKAEGNPFVFRLPSSWYNFVVYKTAFPEKGAEKAQSGEAAFVGLTVRINGFKDDTGKAVVCIYVSNPMNQAPYTSQIVDIQNGVVEAVFENLEYGDYAALAFHDENGNLDVDMDRNIPTEGLGYSNQFSIPMNEPKFENCRFTFETSQSSIEIPIFYYDVP